MFSELMNDQVTLLKRDGTKVNDIQASVQRDMIFIERGDILIETGDLLLRTMSNGGKESYEVIDPGFHEAFGNDFPAHYQVKHRNLGIPEAEKAINQITYNISGNNARVNNNSVDNSTNSVNINNDIAEHIALLRTEISRLVQDSQERESALEVVDAIEGQFESLKPSKTVINTLLSALPNAGSIASVGSFLLSCL